MRLYITAARHRRDRFASQNSQGLRPRATRTARSVALFDRAAWMRAVVEEAGKCARLSMKVGNG